MRKLIASPGGKIAALVVVLAMTLLAAQAADATNPPSRASDAAARVVAHNRSGHVGSHLVGHTRNGRDVTGSFIPLKFVHRNHRLLVRGLVNGVVHQRNGHTSTFAQVRTIRVKSINGTSTRAGTAAAARARCNILRLVLGPLDLDLLGLQVHLNRVVLNIVAVSGAGNLLGNLLCAVSGLLDGGIGGLLGRVTRLLNRILGVLHLG